MSVESLGSPDNNMMNYSTNHFEGRIDFISPAGPLRSSESEINLAAVGTEYDLGTKGELSIPPEDADIWKEWKSPKDTISQAQRALGGDVVKAAQLN
jgi:hypothetical protein